MGLQVIDHTATTSADPATVYRLLRDGASWPVFSPLGSFELERPSDDGEPGEGMVLADIAEVHQAIHVGAVTLHSKITSRVPQTDEQGKEFMPRVETTPGCMLIGECLPVSHSSNGVPCMLLGKLGGKVKAGSYINMPGITNKHVMATVLKAFGMDGAHFGNTLVAGVLS